MSGPEEIDRELRALRDRISALSAAILRISASLDLATVLQEVVDSARALTGARYGVIATVDDAGEVQDFVSSGFSPEEHDQLAEWAEGPRLFEHLRNLPGPLQVGDLHHYVRSLGFSPDLMISSTLQGVPMHHRGVQVGNFFLAGKEGGVDFTSEDEEVVVLFASQAATAIANARAHRDEQRARADLEALIDTSPVGVVVFDAQTGKPVSSNREANRIIDPLRTPDRPAAELLEVLSFRFAHGREVALDRISLAQELKNSRTVRAEEVVVSVPDGRSVSMLVNGTPIHADDGTVASVVVTMQDLAPLKELERLRAEFLGMVSPRVARAAHLHQGLDSLGVGCGARPAARRADAVLPHHRRSGRPHAEPHRQPPRCGAHRGGDAIRGSRAFRCRRACGPGEEHLPERRRQTHGHN